VETDGGMVDHKTTKRNYGWTNSLLSTRELKKSIDGCTSKVIAGELFQAIPPGTTMQKSNLTTGTQLRQRQGNQCS